MSRAARNALAAAVVDECVSGLATFADRGFAPFRDEWRAADALFGRAVRIATALRRRVAAVRAIR